MARGGGLAAWRIVRCNPWCDGGYDPVPPPRSARWARDGAVMDQKRLFLAIAISIAILLGFQYLMPHPPAPLHPPATVEQTAGGQTQGALTPAGQPPAGQPRSAAGAGEAELATGQRGAEECAAGEDRRAAGGGLDQPAGRADRRSGAEGLPRDAGAGFAAGAAAGAAVRRRSHIMCSTAGPRPRDNRRDRQQNCRTMPRCGRPRRRRSAWASR